MKKLLFVIAIIAVSGCTQVIKDRAGPLVAAYCAQPVETRMITRMQVNTALAPRSITIDCADALK